MKNIKLILEYDGTNYCGWQRQKNGVSIEETVENAIRKIVDEEIKLIGSSRTDSGVHARGQAANFVTSSQIPVDRMAAAFNSRLPHDISVISAEEVSETFHARYSSTGKRYSYTILNREFLSPLLRNYSAHYRYCMNFNDMQRAAAFFIGTKDFTGFKSTGGSAKTAVRTIKRLDLLKDNDIIRMYIEADGFLYNMVRIIMGTLVDVGRGRISADDIPEIINSRQRDRAGHTAPPQGLCLEKVYYNP